MDIHVLYSSEERWIYMYYRELTGTSDTAVPEREGRRDERYANTLYTERYKIRLALYFNRTLCYLYSMIVLFTNSKFRASHKFNAISIALSITHGEQLTQ